MANTRKPFQTPSPSHSTELAMPMRAAQPGKPIPPADEPTIRGMMSEAQDGDTAGSEGQDAPAPKSNGALGAYRSTLVPPDGFHVP
jgi:hypothetical protein